MRRRAHVSCLHRGACQDLYKLLRRRTAAQQRPSGVKVGPLDTEEIRQTTEHILQLRWALAETLTLPNTRFTETSQPGATECLVGSDQQAWT